MNSRIENKISMWLVLRVFLQGKVTITTALPGFAELLSHFSSIVDDVLGIMNALGIVFKGYAEEKHEVENQICTKTSEIAGMIKAYAIISGNKLLQEQMSITRTSMMRMSDTVKLAKAQEVHTKAEDLQEDVETYGVTEAIIAELLSLITIYVAVLPQPRQGIVDHKHTNEELNKKVAAGDEIVMKMDALVEIKRYSEPQFYSDYWASHKIIDTGSRTRALQLWAVNDETEEPMVKAKVTIKSKGGTDIMKTVKRTGLKGGITLNTLNEGEYEYEVSFGGFGVEKGSFFVNDGVMTTVNVRMKEVEVPVVS
jgi:hypothetical protein